MTVASLLDDDVFCFFLLFADCDDNGDEVF
jgi:hypothetical protein